MVFIGKGGKWGWVLRLGRLEHFKSLLNGRDGICGETRRRLWYRAGPVSWFGESGEKNLKRGIGGGCGWGILCQYYISVITWRWAACLKTGAQSVNCFSFRRKLLANWNTPVKPQPVLPEKSCTHSSSLYNCEESVFLMFGRKRKTYPPPERCTVGEIKKSILYTVVDVWVKIKKKMKTWGMFHFPVNCTSIYLPYLVCYILYVHNALRQMLY